MKKDFKTALATFKALLFDAQTPEEEGNPTGVEVKAKDGKTYKVAKIEKGEAIEVSGESGDYAAAPDGSVELEDGTILTVKDGKIEEVKVMEQMAAADEAVAGVSKEDFDALKAQFDELKKFVADSLSKAAEAGNVKFAAMLDVVQAVSEEPEANPTGVVKNTAFSKAVTDKDAALAKVRDAFAAAASKK
jgi:hypothetical protein